MEGSDLPGHSAITHILPMTLLPRLCRVHQSPTAHLCCAGEEQFHDVQRPAGFAGQFGMTQTGVDEVDDDGGFALLLGCVGGEFACEEDFKEFGGWVSKGEGD